MRIDELLNNCPVLHVTGDPAVDISSIAYDSRNCTKSSLFVAVQGLKTDGHEYIDQAAARGAIAVVYERDLPLLPAGMTAIRVENSRRALGILGRNYYHDPSSQLFLVGVTGTKGKTTVTYLLESIFQKAGLSAGVLGTVNYRFGGKIMPASNTTPESIEMQKMLRLMVDEGVTHVVAEVSSHAVDLRRIDDCAFDIGVFTNLAQDHLDYHLTLENYYQVKRRFFTEVIPEGGKKQQPQRIINADDAWGKRLIDELDSGSLTYGIDSPCHVRAEKYDLAIDAIRADIASPWGGLHVMSGLTGKFNLYNILAAVASALSFGIEPEAVQEGVKALSSVPGRLEKVKTGIDAEPMVFVDYAHTEDALRKVLESLRHFKEGKIITVFGCGGDRDRGKRPLMGAAVAELSDMAIVTSDNPRTEDPLAIIDAIEKGISGTVMARVLPVDFKLNQSKVYTVIPDRKTAIEAAIAVADPSDIVLIAGKGHEDYQIIGSVRFPFDDRMIAKEALTEQFHKGKL